MADPISHVPYSRLVDYAFGSLGATEGGEIEAHLAECPVCSLTLKRLLVIMDQLRVDDHDRPPEALIVRAAAIARQRPVRWTDRLRMVPARFGQHLSHVSLAQLLLVVAVTTLGARTVVEKSQTTLPGDVLYPVKRMNERVILATNWNDISQAKIHVRLLRIRVNEIVALTETGRYEAVAASVTDLQSEIDDAAVAFRAVTSHDVPAGIAFVQQVEQNLNDSAQKFSALALGGPPGALPALRSAVAASVAGQGVVRAQLPASALAALALTAPAPTLPAVAATALASTSLPEATPTVTGSAHPTLTPSLTPLGTRATSTPMVTASQPATVTGPAPHGSPTSSPSVTPVASATPSPTQMATPIPSRTPEPTNSATPAPSATNTPLPTDTPLPTVTVTPLPTLTHTPAPTDTATPLPTASDTPVPTATDTPLPTASDTPVPTDTDTPFPTATDTPAPTETPTPATTFQS